MPKRTDLNKILVIGSGPIIIGQAAEFDYAGTQACLALKEEGYEVVLVNCNPATIMTDTWVADAVYMEPLTKEFLHRVIAKERPDAILGSLGGQTGLNLVVELESSGILEAFQVEVLGTKIDAIEHAEDRDLFRNLMYEIKEPVPVSEIVTTVEEAIDFSNEIGFPLIIRPAFTLGGTGGGIASNIQELKEITKSGLDASPVTQCLIERSIAGWKEIEYEVIRDDNDTALVICNMENIDPVGIHTGDSIVVAPAQTLTNREHQILRNASLKIIRALKICGGCNVQLAMHPTTQEYFIIEVNPRLSRSSALASKATGYPIAKVAAKLAVGYHLDELINPITHSSYACTEPSVDYVVTKFPRFAFDKFVKADRKLGTQMKATGEVMAIGRTFEESILKAVRSLEIKTSHLELKSLKDVSMGELFDKMLEQDDERIFAIVEILRRNGDIHKIHEMTMMDYFFLSKLQHIVSLEKEARGNQSLDLLKELKVYGFADETVACLWDKEVRDVELIRKENGIKPVYKMVDTCAGEFASRTPYYYSTYEDENEVELSSKEKVIVLGSGPIRIGQGVEFDYATVHCVKTLRELGYEAIVVNNNPETVSTDFSISDKLYFEPLTIEDVMHIIELENPLGVIVQFGGQTAINLAEELSERGVKILGTSVDNIDNAEDRHKFEAMLRKMSIPQPTGETALTVEEALDIASRIHYPVLVRPSYVLGGRAMEIVHSDEELKIYMSSAVKEISHDAPILVDKYIIGKEVEVDAISDGNTVVIPGIMEHIERAGVHSGDSISVYPTISISQKVKDAIVEYTQKIGKGFQFIGLFNIQFIVDKDEQVYVLEVNPRSSRTMPFLSKVTKLAMADIATKAIMGTSLVEQGYVEEILQEEDIYYVKAPVFSFAKLRSVDTVLGPEMKSTGEALGKDKVLEKALYKALVGSNVKIPIIGNVLMTLADETKSEGLEIAKQFASLGFGIYGTKGTAEFLRSNGVHVKTLHKVSETDDENLLKSIREGDVDYIVNTFSQTKDSNLDGFLIRRVAAENNVSCFTSLDTANAMLRVLEMLSFQTIPMK